MAAVLELAVLAGGAWALIAPTPASVPGWCGRKVPAKTLNGTGWTGRAGPSEVPAGLRKLPTNEASKIDRA